jgi:hypothetical protein
MNYSTFENFGTVGTVNYIPELKGTVSGGPKINNVLDSNSLPNINDRNHRIRQMQPIVKTVNKPIKESFVNLDASSSPYGSDSPIDVFSGTKGNISCDGNSSGLTNSMGGLCLNDNLKKLLSTRGGNATGSDSQIG